MSLLGKTQKFFPWKWCRIALGIAWRFMEKPQSFQCFLELPLHYFCIFHRSDKEMQWTLWTPSISPSPTSPSCFQIWLGNPTHFFFWKSMHTLVISMLAFLLRSTPQGGALEGGWEGLGGHDLPLIIYRVPLSSSNQSFGWNGIDLKMTSNSFLKKKLIGEWDCWISGWNWVRT